MLPFNRKHQAKQEMRALLIQKRRMLTKEECKQLSNQIIERLEDNPTFQQAKSILIYYPIQNEVDLLPLVKKYKHEKLILFPVVHRKEMTANPYEGNHNMHRNKIGIPEPTTAPYQGKIDLILTPAVAFDKKGNRLGRGGGYYDRFLKKVSHAKLIGVGYDFQLVDSVPVKRHDQKVEQIILPSQTILI